ncbi:UNVERIFIED_CONTAM: hypothetical protein FKN15_051937 [Acipenser sinensis]
MESIELIARINQNTAAQKEQTERWRLELGLREPTELDLLLQKWEVELPSREPEEVELSSREPEGVELPSREPEGVELPSREPEGVELPSREPEGVELPSREPEGVELFLSPEPPAEVKGQEVSNSPPTEPQQQARGHSGAIKCGPVLQLHGHQPGMPRPPSTRPCAQVAGRSGTVACLVPTPLPLGTQTSLRRRKTSLCKKQTSLALPLLVAPFPLPTAPLPLRFKTPRASACQSLLPVTGLRYSRPGQAVRVPSCWCVVPS